MKKLCVMFLCLAITSYVYAYETIPYMFNNLIPYGISPDEVNEILIASNFITTGVEPESGTFYISQYPDPDLVWYYPLGMKWANLKFTTERIENLFKRDLSILYFSYQNDDEFKMMTIDSEVLGEAASDTGAESKWVYKFFFHNDELFAVSSVYKGDAAIEQYKERNPNNKYANPGYIMSTGLFERTLNGFKNKYGGFYNSKRVTLDPFATMNYGNYANASVNTSLSLYYLSYNNKNANFTVSYIDNYRITPIFLRFQNKKYESYFDIADVPAGIPVENGINKKQ